MELRSPNRWSGWVLTIILTMTGAACSGGSPEGQSAGQKTQAAPAAPVPDPSAPAATPDRAAPPAPTVGAVAARPVPNPPAAPAAAASAPAGKTSPALTKTAA